MPTFSKRQKKNYKKRLKKVAAQPGLRIPSLIQHPLHGAFNGNYIGDIEVTNVLANPANRQCRVSYTELAAAAVTLSSPPAQIKKCLVESSLYELLVKTPSTASQNKVYDLVYHFLETPNNHCTAVNNFASPRACQKQCCRHDPGYRTSWQS